MGTLTEMRRELEEMLDVMMGRTQPPINNGIMTLMEIAAAYNARAAEINFYLLQGEAKGLIPKGSAHYKFRTGELRQFLELSSKTIDLGSRRVTAAQLEHDMKETDL